MSDAEKIMLNAISNIGMARSLKRTSKVRSIIELNKSVVLMNKSIKLEPNNIENRKSRLRHLIGVTMNSPKNFKKEIKDDILFFESCFSTLNSEDKSFFLSALGEYEIYCGNKEIGIKHLNDCVNNYPESTMFHYNKILLETIK